MTSIAVKSKESKGPEVQLQDRIFSAQRRKSTFITINDNLLLDFDI